MEWTHLTKHGQASAYSNTLPNQASFQDPKCICRILRKHSKWGFSKEMENPIIPKLPTTNNYQKYRIDVLCMFLCVLVAVFNCWRKVAIAGSGCKRGVSLCYGYNCKQRCFLMLCLHSSRLCVSLRSVFSGIYCMR